MKTTIGILAHVDAGKTTLSEQLLFRTGVLAKPGSIQEKNTLMDQDPMETERGITVFSGLASFPLGGDTYYLLDTPGHVDFASDMERALSALDLGILLISAPDGIQGHTLTLWSLLEQWKVPTLVFLNKCDRGDADADTAVAALSARFHAPFLDMRRLQKTGQLDDTLIDDASLLSEELTEACLSGNMTAAILLDCLRPMVAQRAVFPVFSGSALTGEGMDSFLRLLHALTPFSSPASDALSGFLFQVRYEGNTRIAFWKILSGTLRPKDVFPLTPLPSKVQEIRRYRGRRYEILREAEAGDIVGIPMREGRIGDTLGGLPSLVYHVSPMISATLLWDRSRVPAFQVAQYMRQLEEEDPELHVEEDGDTIRLRILGRMQLDMLKEKMQARYALPVSFGPMQILYHETVAAPVIGIGHYEPLRHYAEVHVRLLPGPRGSGIRFRSVAHVDDLALNWQRLIRTHVFEKEHRSILTGSPLTDVTVELLCGRAHLKHTEGGDFREATYRAIQNALRFADAVLLEPLCRFTLRFPEPFLPAVTRDMLQMHASTDSPVFENGEILLTGSAPYAAFAPWQETFPHLTHGKGSLQAVPAGEAVARNSEEIIAARQYRPGPQDTGDSVFCAHGAGFVVQWSHVREWAHLPDPEDPDALPETCLSTPEEAVM